ncbi:polysaccharide deacetylase family protein [Streptomyces sp. WMMC1477]|nr:polysaccharide deacetylase family protein [Streptomyces sp. WMMC1477]MCZ7433007.1 polysaccharide deacetylase family protein [Streptomyces sp. WMMC1477]
MSIIRQVTQNDRESPRPWRHLRRGVGAGALAALAVSCAAVAGTGHLPTGEDGGGSLLDKPLAAAVEGLPLGAAQRVGAEYAAASLTAYAGGLARAETRRVAAAARWGLAEPPLLAPPPPAAKPELTSTPGLVSGKGLPPVFVRVPTDQKVVFLTIDDGWHKDPRFTRMLRELRIPYSAFLSDYVAAEDYDYFRRMRRDGAGVHNHTLNHKELPKLSYKRQREEICGMQKVLKEEFGAPSRLFRPPYGAYDRDTLRAAASCGVEAVPLWAEEAWAQRFDWARLDREFHPGDIILTHFRGPEQWGGTMNDMLRRTLKTATEQGFALARLEDYV